VFISIPYENGSLSKRDFEIKTRKTVLKLRSESALKFTKGEITIMQLKPISEQTIVITGATSGIGLTTARMAAENGARVVLIARNEAALRELADEINSGGGRAIYAAADVADENALREAARKTVERFGGFDTWVNNAGGSIYGRIMDVPTDDLRRLFETNVWGVVNGSRVAVEHLKERGGALINVGSEVSDAPIPLQGMYSSSKHAVKGFTDALRMEVEADGFPISVTLVKPTAIHTPFPENARNYLPYEPQLPNPLYAPELVAEAILHCAENPTRDFFVGETAKLHSSMAMFAPRFGEKMNEMTIDSAQNSGKPAKPNRPDGLYETNSNLRERGSDDRFVLEDSLYQRAKIRPFLTGALAIGGGVALAAWLSSRSGQTEDEKPKSLSATSGK
jgi:short-subunit dehydrogenase